VAPGSQRDTPPGASTVLAVGRGVRRRAFHCFLLSRRNSLRRSHKRGNAESPILNRKLRDSLRSKTLPAMDNDALCKLLDLSIAVVIHEQEEHGIGQVFRGDGGADGPAILKFPGCVCPKCKSPN
jgi:hypothetical protein